jgi:hypothetical protein
MSAGHHDFSTFVRDNKFAPNIKSGSGNTLHTASGALSAEQSLISANAIILSDFWHQ